MRAGHLLAVFLLLHLFLIWLENFDYNNWQSEQDTGNGDRSADATELPLEDEKSGHSNEQETKEQRENGAQIETVGHVELLEKFAGESEMTVGLGAGERRPLQAVDGHQRSFEGISHEAQIGHPSHVHRNGADVDEESGEQQERDRCRRR